MSDEQKVPFAGVGQPESVDPPSDPRADVFAAIRKIGGTYGTVVFAVSDEGEVVGDECSILDQSRKLVSEGMEDGIDDLMDRMLDEVQAHAKAYVASGIVSGTVTWDCVHETVTIETFTADADEPEPTTPTDE